MFERCVFRKHRNFSSFAVLNQTFSQLRSYYNMTFNSLASQIQEMQILDICTQRNSYHTSTTELKI